MLANITQKGRRMLNIRTDTLDNIETADIIGISPSTLNTWRSRGKGPKWHRIAGRIRYIKTDVEAWLQAQMTTV